MRDPFQNLESRPTDTDTGTEHSGWQLSLPKWIGLGIVLIILLSLWGEVSQRLVSDKEPQVSKSELSLTAADKRRLREKYRNNPDGLNAAEFALAAEAENEAFLRNWREQKRASRPVPIGKDDAHARWRKHVAHLEESLAQFDSFPEGSVQWHLQRALEEANMDEPPR